MQGDRWVVSVESLDVPARSAVLKSLHARLALDVIVDADRPQSAFVGLLHRMRALTRLPFTRHVMFSGSWLLRVPTDPDLVKLYVDLGDALVDALGVHRSRHLMVCMRVDVDEAFEAALMESPRSPPVWLHTLEHAQNQLLRADRAASCSPFRTYTITVDCPPYAADTATTLEALVDRVQRAVQAVVT